MDLYQRAGAKYFLSMGVHHDGYDLWNSKYHPAELRRLRPPQRYRQHLGRRRPQARGLRFGVSEHLSNAFDWFAPSHLADTKGPYANIPYDGQNPAFADLYHDYSTMPPNFARTILPDPMGRTAPDAWKLHYFNPRQRPHRPAPARPPLHRRRHRIQRVRPGTVAELYNVGPYSYQNKSEAIYFSKTPTDCPDATSCVIDHERSVLNQIDPNPWQPTPASATGTTNSAQPTSRQKSHRHASRHRQQKRQPSSSTSHSPPRASPTPKSSASSKPSPSDLHQRRSHLLHPPLEDPRRRPLHQSRHPHRPDQI